MLSYEKSCNSSNQGSTFPLALNYIGSAFRDQSGTAMSSPCPF